MRSIASESIDCIFADPPFNIGKEYNNGHSDLLSQDKYLDWCRLWVTEAVRLVKDGGAIFVYNLPRWAYHLASYLEEQEMEFRHWIAVSMKGTFPRGKKLYPAHYALLYFTKGTPKTFNRIRLPIPTCRHCGKDIKDYGGHRKYLNPAGLNLTDFWEDTSPARHRKNKSRWHINELKPIIPERCIQISTNPGDIVLDPFGGGGSTYVTAEHLHRRWLGTEIGPCEPILERFGREFPFVEMSTEVPEQIKQLFKPSPPALAHA
jgi:site-specific DNA-methyltransferase (adenine-specific)